MQIVDISTQCTTRYLTYDLQRRYRMRCTWPLFAKIKTKVTTKHYDFPMHPTSLYIILISLFCKNSLMDEILEIIINCRWQSRIVFWSNLFILCKQMFLKSLRCIVNTSLWTSFKRCYYAYNEPQLSSKDIENRKLQGLETLNFCAKTCANFPFENCNAFKF